MDDIPIVENVEITSSTASESMRRDMSIVVQLGFAFFLVFTAFNSQGFIEISVLRSLSTDGGSSGIVANSGYYSLAIIYFVFTLSNLITPPIISKLGPKWSMVLGALCYCAFLAGFLHLSAPLLYALSALLGFGAALLWTGNGVYLVQFSRDGKMARNSGIMWAMMQSSLVAGSIFLIFVLNTGDLVSSYRLVYTVFSAVSVAGVLVLVTLPSHPVGMSSDGLEDRLIEEDEDAEPISAAVTTSEPTPSIKAQLGRIFDVLRTHNMAILSVVFMYSGLEMTFVTGIYSACLHATTALIKDREAIIAYTVLSIGAGEILGGLWFGIRATTARYGRKSVVVFGMILHFISFFLCFLNLPASSPLHKTADEGYISPSVAIALITGFLLGLGDAIWSTQIYAIVGGMYKDSDSSSAFALFKFFQSMTAFMSFFYSSVLMLHWQLLILVIGAFVATLSFFAVHDRARRADPIEE